MFEYYVTELRTFFKFVDNNNDKNFKKRKKATMTVSKMKPVTIDLFY